MRIRSIAQLSSVFCGMAVCFGQQPGTILDARTDVERCAAVRRWFNDIVLRSNGGVANEKAETIAALAAYGYRSAVGKSLESLSNQDRRTIAKALDKCGPEAWMGTMVGHLFKVYLPHSQVKEFSRFVAQAGSVSNAVVPPTDVDASAMIQRRARMSELIAQIGVEDKSAEKEYDQLQAATLRAVQAATQAYRRKAEAELERLESEKVALETARASVARRREHYAELLQATRFGMPSLPSLERLALARAETLIRHERQLEERRNKMLADVLLALQANPGPTMRASLQREAGAHRTARRMFDLEWQACNTLLATLGRPSVEEMVQARALEARRLQLAEQRERARTERLSNAKSTVLGILGLTALAAYVFLASDAAFDEAPKDHASEASKQLLCDAMGLPFCP